LARRLDISEKKALSQTRRLAEDGIIRRIGPVINYRTLSQVATLVTAQVPEHRLDEAAQSLNDMDGVSHNYLRNHRFNLWFTLQQRSFKEIEKTISALSAKFGTKFHSLRTQRVFRLNVLFDAASGGKRLLDAHLPLATEPVGLSNYEKKVLLAMSPNLPVVEEPFAEIFGSAGQADAIKTLAVLTRKGVIRRTGATVNHRRLGFLCNVLVCCEVDEDDVSGVGSALAACQTVSHCYQRKTFDGWEYNLFAMMHGPDIIHIRRAVEEFASDFAVKSYVLLQTVSELKKRPVSYDFLAE